MIYLNIETTPPPGTAPDIKAVRAPKNYKDPDKIRAYQLEHAQDYWAKQALEPYTAHVVVVSMAIEDGEPVVSIDMDESRLLTGLEQLMSVGSIKHDRWVTFNGQAFDWPVLFARAVKYGLPNLASVAHTAMESRREHPDIFRMLGREGSLDQWGRFYQLAMRPGEPFHNPIDGSEIGNMLNAGRHDLVTQHTTTRVTILREITKRIAAVGLL